MIWRRKLLGLAASGAAVAGAAGLPAERFAGELMRWILGSPCALPGNAAHGVGRVGGAEFLLLFLQVNPQEPESRVAGSWA